MPQRFCSRYQRNPANIAVIGPSSSIRSIVAKVPGAQGGEVYLRQGRVLPESVTNDEIKRLTALGLVEKFTVEETTDADAAGAGSQNQQ